MTTERMYQIAGALMLLLLALMAAAQCMAMPFRHSKVDKAFVTATVAELKDAALIVGDYQKYPPQLTTGKADEMYVQRAEADIVVAMGALTKYRHHSATKQDVESVMSQLSRDLEDIPPAMWPDADKPSKI